ncbi:MAG: hypothetical protein ACJ8H8_11500, partial [Geminicoccaceae bacterium]
ASGPLLSVIASRTAENGTWTHQGASFDRWWAAMSIDHAQLDGTSGWRRDRRCGYMLRNNSGPEVLR